MTKRPAKLTQVHAAREARAIAYGSSRSHSIARLASMSVGRPQPLRPGTRDCCRPDLFRCRSIGFNLQCSISWASELYCCRFRMSGNVKSFESCLGLAGIVEGAWKYRKSNARCQPRGGKMRRFGHPPTTDERNPIAISMAPVGSRVPSSTPHCRPSET